VRRTEDGSSTKLKIQFSTSTLGLQDTVLHTVYILRPVRAHVAETGEKLHRLMGLISLSLILEDITNYIKICRQTNGKIMTITTERIG
jgi:hypothetical protein